MSKFLAVLFVISLLPLVMKASQVQSQGSTKVKEKQPSVDPELQNQIDKILEDTKNVGAVGQPVSEETKAVLDSSTRLQLHRKNPEGQFSTDCKFWKTIDPNKAQSELNTNKMFYKTLEGGFLSLIGIPQQTIFSYDNNRLFYTKVYSGAITGLVNGVPFYREIEGEKIQPGLAGVLQGIVLIAAESSSSWLLTGSGNTVRLLHMLIGKKDKALENYTSLVCTKEDKCFLITKDKSSEELRLASKEHMALKDAGIFSVDKIGVFFRMCEAIDNKAFFDSLAQEAKEFEGACSQRLPPNLSSIAQSRASRICSELKYHILPIMKIYR